MDLQDLSEAKALFTLELFKNYIFMLNLFTYSLYGPSGPLAIYGGEDGRSLNGQAAPRVKDLKVFSSQSFH